MKLLYVTNFPPGIGEDVLPALFAEFGEIGLLEVAVDEHTGLPFALVEMASEKVATRASHGLNGRDVEGYRLAVSPAELDLSRELTAKNRKTIEDIIATLGEMDKVPLRQVEAIVRFCGTSFAEALLEEALVIEEGEGLSTTDGVRRRTKGGVFFYLARYRMSPELRKLVYNRKGKVPGVEYD